MSDADHRPAFYAARRGGLGQWWTLLHPPYTAWHLSYVVIGASLAPRVDTGRLLATLLAFLLAVGVAAHLLDELHGRPLRTTVPSATLVAVSAVTLAGAVGLGVAGVGRVGLALVPFIVVGVVLVLGYDLELLGGRLHSTAAFAAGWGAFPVLTAYLAQTGGLGVGAVIVAAAAFGLSWAQRRLSTPARLLRRHVVEVSADLVLDDGRTLRWDATDLLRPLEQALRVLSWSMVALAAGLAVARLR
ncbi:MAG: hypothetical protein E6J03_09375 [Chloroflexi bacterium]|nr:MAG: hypothetical protein E6J03_09375 [Chloroflexota bacterium]